jgi:WD40 repeat protein
MKIPILRWSLPTLLFCFLILNPILAQKPELVVQAGHRNMIRALAVTGDGKWIASAGADKTVFLWDVDSGKQILSLTGHKEWVFALAFSSDRKFLASGSFDGEIKVWNLETAKVEYNITSVMPYSINSLAFSLDDRTLVIASADKVINLWDMKEGRIMSPITGHTAQVTQVVVHHLSGLIFSASLDKTIRTSKISEGTSKEFYSLKQGITGVAFNPAGNIMALSATGGTIGVLDFSKGQGPPGALLIQPQEHPATPGKIDYRRWRTIFETTLYPAGRLSFVSDTQLAINDGYTFSLWDVGKDERSIYKEIENGNGSYGMVYNKTKNLLIYGDGSDVRLLNLSTREYRVLEAGYLRLQSIAFSRDARTLAGLSELADAFIWDDFRKVEIDMDDLMVAASNLMNAKSVLISSQGILLTAHNEKSGNIRVFDALNKKNLAPLIGHTKQVKSLALSPDENTLVSGQEGLILIWDMKTKKVVSRLNENNSHLQFSPDGRFLAVLDTAKETLKIWRLNQWAKPAFTIYADLDGTISFSPDSKTIGGIVDEIPEEPSLDKDPDPDCRRVTRRNVRSRKLLKLWSLPDGVLAHSFAVREAPKDFDLDSFLASKSNCEPFAYTAFSNIFEDRSTVKGGLAFSPDSKLVAYVIVDYLSGNNQIGVWSTVSGKQVSLLPGHADSIRSIVFSPNKKVFASASWDGTVKIWSIEKGEEIATILPFNGEKWVIYTQDGRFDTNLRLDEMNKLNWIWPEAPFDRLPVRVFMRDYLERNLVGKVLADEKLKAVRDISKLNRTQPIVRIKEVTPDGAGTVRVTVDVSDETSKTQKDDKGGALRSGVFDLRLFRDHQLVGGSTKEKAQAEYLAAANIQESSSLSDREFEAWRTATAVKLDGSDKATVTFSGIKVPRRQGLKQVEFSAYAFNNDRVTSESSIFTYNLPAGAKTAKRRAYLITVGVDANQSGANWNMNFASKSSANVSRVISRKLTPGYEVVNISLVSDFEPDSPRVALKQATKENIRNVLAILGGREVDAESKKRIPNGASLAAATPDDLVFLYIASHGYSDPKENFYVIPYDTGPALDTTEESLNKCLSGDTGGTDCQAERTFIKNAISTPDLTLWWQGVDAGQIVMVLDSCYSATVVRENDFKAGPLGDNSFAQLSYDKRMIILAASQKSALAASRTGVDGTLLSSMLLELSVEKPDDSISLMLERAKSRVPGLYRKLYPDATGEDLQVPILFDFFKE